jgi:hypothetical protein
VTGGITIAGREFILPIARDFFSLLLARKSHRGGYWGKGGRGDGGTGALCDIVT